MPCVVEICFPIRDSACILVRSKLVKSQEEKKQRLGQIEESKSETKYERHFLPKTLSCHQLLMPCQCSPSISPQNAQGPFFCVKLVNCFFLVVCFSNPACFSITQPCRTFFKTSLRRISSEALSPGILMLAAFQICIFVPIPSIFLVFQVFIPKFELR